MSHNYLFSPFLVLRRPAYSPKQFNEAALTKCLTDNFFLSALRLASIDLYNELQKAHFKYDQLKVPAQMSIARYFNRMCYRPTPFGLFASFSYLPWVTTGTINNDLPIEKLHLLPDFANLHKTLLDLGPEHYCNTSLWINPTFYRTAKVWRYLRPAGNLTSSGPFELEHSVLLEKVLRLGFLPRPYQEILSFLSQEVSSPEDAELLLQDLINTGIILSELLPNCSGQIVHERLKQIPELSAELAFRKQIERTTIEKPGTSVVAPSAPIYSVYEREGKADLERDLQKKLRAGLDALLHLTEEQPSEILSKFKKRFLKRYDRQQVQLLEALDPEIGIGYPLEIENKNKIREQHQSSSNWNATRQLLLRLLCGKRPGEIVYLEDHHLQELGSFQSKACSSLSMLFRSFGEKVWIEAVVPNGLSLIARFCHFNEKLHQEAKQVAAAEECVNSNVIFAEVHFLENGEADNINIRPAFYQYEIPVLTASTLPTSNQIALDDLYLSMDEGTLLLWSKKLKKRVIPRLSSSYNYQRSALSVIRFLCDLQYDELEPSLVFSLPTLFPGMIYYPRVEYGNAIVQPATWVLKQGHVVALRKNKTCEVTWVDLVTEYRIPRYFYVGYKDRQLLIDQEQDLSLKLFFDYLKKQDNIILIEAFVSDNGDITEEYTRQFIAPLVNNRPSWPNLEYCSFHRSKAQVQRRFLPGNEWLSIKLYCAAQFADKLLISSIKDLLQQMKRKKEIEKWFFLRYADPEHHLRLRIHSSSSGLPSIFQKVNSALKTEFETGRLSDLQCVPYERELERYGSRTIEEAESAFEASSELALWLLQQELNEDEIWRFAMHSVFTIAWIFIPSVSLADFFYRNYICFFKELGLGKEDRLKMNNQYRQKAELVKELDKMPGNCPGGYKRLLKKFKDSVLVYSLVLMEREIVSKEKVCADVVHMHINRLFYTRQKQQEMMLYFTFWKARFILGLN